MFRKGPFTCYIRPYVIMVNIPQRGLISTFESRVFSNSAEPHLGIRCVTVKITIMVFVE